MSFLASHTFSAVTLFSILTVIGQIVSVVLFFCLVLERVRREPSSIVTWCARYGLILMFIVALTATLGSLFFSDIAGWTPCKDCWFQRIFMYPQVFLLAVALWRRDRTIAYSIIILSLVGMIISIDHYVDQVSLALHPVSADNPLVPCDGTGVSCAKTQIHFTFGYITLPMMALTGFLLNILGSFALLRRKTAA
jgi:disulfide bond formation protein DsbB